MTKNDIPDLRGIVSIKIEGNSGLDYESVMAFANLSAALIMMCRSIEKAEWDCLFRCQGKNQRQTGTHQLFILPSSLPWNSRLNTKALMFL